MIRYIQNKSIDYGLLQDLLRDSTRINQFTNVGPTKLLLEKHLHGLLNLPPEKVVICSANGTLALHTLLFFYKKRNITKFASPSYTFPSCIVGGFRTKVYDISLENFSFDSAEEDKIIEDNDCLIITNLFGTYPKNLKSILKKCKDNSTIVILDNASSPLTKINGKNLCSFGDASFGSLHHTKYLGFGEGGFIVIDRIHEKEINNIMGFGFSSKNSKRISQTKSSNFKISDISSAAILQHIKTYDIERHILNQNLFIGMMNSIEGVEIFNYAENVIYGNLPILYKKPIKIDFFRNNNIEAQKYYYPLKKHKNSIFLYDRLINLPLHSKLSEFEIEKMVRIIRDSINE